MRMRRTITGRFGSWEWAWVWVWAWWLALFVVMGHTPASKRRMARALRHSNAHGRAVFYPNQAWGCRFDPVAVGGNPKQSAGRASWGRDVPGRNRRYPVDGAAASRENLGECQTSAIS